jgi:hypothetical protein
LHHGGGDDINNKPNYVSVMNYNFQFSGIIENGASGTFDYSRSTLGDLNEGSLPAESSGIPGAVLGTPTFGSRHYCRASNTQAAIANITGGIDWNCDGNTSDGALAGIDITGDTATNEVLHGYNDWAHLVYNGGAIGQGAPPTDTQVPPTSVANDLPSNPTLAQLMQQTVPVDIEPRFCPNVLSSDGPRPLPVSILGRSNVDVTQIVPSSVRLAGAAPLVWLTADIASPGNLPDIGKTAANCTTAGTDGFKDLNLVFDARAVYAGLHSPRIGAKVTVPLTAKLTNGDLVIGEDVVTIINPDLMRLQRHARVRSTGIGHE